MISLRKHNNIVTEAYEASIICISLYVLPQVYANKKIYVKHKQSIYLESPVIVLVFR